LSGRSIQARVVLLVGTGIVAALAGLGGTAWTGLDRMAARLSAERLLLARTMAGHVDHLVQSDMEVLQGVSGAPGLGLDAAGIRAAAPALREAYLRCRLVERVMLIGPDGAVLLSEPESSGAASPAVPDVAVALTTGRPAASNLVGQAGGRRLYLLVPMRNWRGEVFAVAAGEIDPAGTRLSAALDPFQFPGPGSVDLLDTSGYTIASTDRGRRVRLRDDAPVMTAALHDRRAIVGPGTGADAQMMLALAPLTAARWGLLVRQDESVSFGQARSVRYTIAWLGPLLLALALLFAWGAARSVRRPIALLTDSAERIAYGNLNQPIPDLGRDEIGRLG
jgi:HAMP domain-containing protein